MPNSVPAFLDEHIALGAADRPAIVTPSGAITYGKRWWAPRTRADS